MRVDLLNKEALCVEDAQADNFAESFFMAISSGGHVDVRIEDEECNCLDFQMTINELDKAFLDIEQRKFILTSKSHKYNLFFEYNEIKSGSVTSTGDRYYLMGDAVMITITTFF